MSETPSRSQVAERARAWWRDLQPADERGQVKDGDRAALARLRRCATPADAMVEEATLALFRRLGLKATDHHRLPRVALIAMVLAHVRADAESGADGFRPAAARAVGRASLEDEDSAKMSVLRFRRLLSARDDAELAQQMRRLVALADGGSTSATSPPRCSSGATRTASAGHSNTTRQAPRRPATTRRRPPLPTLVPLDRFPPSEATP